jgi:MFS family permease
MKTKITHYQWHTLWASTIGYAMDDLDMMILSFSLPLIIAFYGLNSIQAGFISTITLLGAVIGGLIFGVLADKIGQVKTFT